MRKEVIGNATLYHGDCREILPTISEVNAIISDPPYPEIDRDYGRFTEEEWHELMDGIAARMDKVRAYGNAIVAPVAEEFIRAYRECRTNS